MNAKIEFLSGRVECMHVNYFKLVETCDWEFSESWIALVAPAKRAEEEHLKNFMSLAGVVYM